MEKCNQTKEEFGMQGVESLYGFFDLLARFDYEDKQKENSVLKTDLLESAPKGSVLSSEI